MLNYLGIKSTVSFLKWVYMVRNFTVSATLDEVKSHRSQQLLGIVKIVNLCNFSKSGEVVAVVWIDFNFIFNTSTSTEVASVLGF